MEREPTSMSTCTSASHSASASHSTSASQDSGRARRSVAYRLFPIVEPTPPASPVTRRKTTLSNARGSSRRRSLSLENAARDPVPASAPTSLLPATTFRPSRKASLPELIPLRTVQERDTDASPPATPQPVLLPSAAPCQGQDEDSDPGRSSSAQGESATGGQHMSRSGAPPQQHPLLPPSSPNSRRHHPMGPPSEQSADCPSPLAGGKHSRSKPKPNLRIAVFPNTNGRDRPPPPPPKSPRHLRDESDLSYTTFSTGPSLSPVSPTNVRWPHPPQTPSRAHAAVAQQQSIVPVNGEAKLRKLTVAPPTAREPTSPTTAHTIIPSEFLKDRCPALQPPSSSYDADARPSTAHGPSPVPNPRTSSLPLKRSLASLRNAAFGAASDEPPKSATRMSFKPQLRLFSASRDRVASAVRPPNPSQARKDTNNDFTERKDASNDFTGRKDASNDLTESKDASNDFSESKDASNDFTDELGRNSPGLLVETTADSTGHPPRRLPPPITSPHETIADVIRKHTFNRTHTSSTSAGDSRSFALEPKTPAQPSLLDHSANAALAAARATVAALRQSNSSSGSVEPFDRSRSPGADLGALDRALTVEALSRQPPTAGHADPVQRLKSLSEESEALHARYASLRVERQKISTGIIANMNEQKPGPEYVNKLLDDQLSLAAVSSSMDICFAKLKSLECRKEDAIAALVAQTTASKTSPADNISLMIASMARKPSLAPSTDSGSRFARTGRSTPDMGDSRSVNRSTASSLPRIVSYTSEADSQDYSMSGSVRNASLGSEAALPSDVFDKQPPETIPELVESPRSRRLTRIHEPSEDGEQAQAKEDTVYDAEAQDLESAPSSMIHGANTHAADHTSRPSSSEDSAPDSLLDQPKRIRVHWSKAAEILGILPKTPDCAEFPLMRLPDGAGGKINTAVPQDAEVELETRSTPVRQATAASNEASLLSASIYSSTLSNPVTSLDKLESPSAPDLAAQLEFFPKPAPSRPTRRPPAVPAPASAPPKRSEENERQMRRHDSSMSMASRTSSNKRPSSQKSAHTIQVYLDSDQDDIVELYRLRTAAATANFITSEAG